MPVLSVTEEDIAVLLRQLPSDARRQMFARFDVSFEDEETRVNPRLPKESSESILEFLDSLPEGPRSAESWEAIERNFQNERNSWDR